MNNTAAEVFLISISRDEIRIMNRLFVRFEFIPRNTLIFWIMFLIILGRWRKKFSGSKEKCQVPIFVN